MVCKLRKGRDRCLGGVRRKSSGVAEDPQPAFVMPKSRGGYRPSYVSGSGDRPKFPSKGEGTKYVRIEESLSIPGLIKERFLLVEIIWLVNRRTQLQVQRRNTRKNTLVAHI